MTVSLSQTMIRLVLPSAISAGEQIAPGLCQRRVDGAAIIDVVGPGLRGLSPRRRPGAEVCVLVALDQPVADVADVDGVPVELTAWPFRYALTSARAWPR